MASDQSEMTPMTSAAQDEPPPVCERCGQAFAEREVAVAAGGSNGNVYYHARCVKPKGWRQWYMRWKGRIATW